MSGELFVAIFPRQQFIQLIATDVTEILPLHVVEDKLTNILAAAVTKVDAQQTNELAVVLDEKRVGSQILTINGDTAILQTVVRGIVALVPENTQGHIGQGRTELSAADVTVGDGDDLFSL